MRTTLNLPDSLVDILYAVENIKIEISWDEIIRMQTENLKNGINKVGISDHCSEYHPE